MTTPVGARVRTNIQALLVLTAVLATAATVRWVGPAVFGGTYDLVVAVPDTGGVQTGHPVTVRGTAVGTIAATRVTTDGVDLVLRLERDRPAPADALVQVLRRSAIGEPALELTPVAPDWRPEGPFVPSQVPVDDSWEAAVPGSRLVPAAFVAPSSVPLLLDRAERLLAAIPGPELATVVDELGTAVDGRVEAIRALATDGAELAETLVTVIPDAERLVSSSAPVLQALQRQRDDLAGAITDTSDVLVTLAEGRRDVERSLTDATPTLTTLDRLVRDQRANITCLGRDVEALGDRLDEPDDLGHLARILDLNRYFYGGFDAATTWDPYRPGVIWARVNILLEQQAAGQPRIPRTPTPATRPGAACTSVFGPGVQAVRQTDPPPLPPDETAPGIGYAPLVAGADAGDHDGVRAGAEGGDATGGRRELPATGGGSLLTLAVASTVLAWSLRRR